MSVRHVVTGHDAHGKAIIVDHQVVEPTTVALMPTAYVKRRELMPTPITLATAVVTQAFSPN